MTEIIGIVYLIAFTGLMLKWSVEAARRGRME